VLWRAGDISTEPRSNLVGTAALIEYEEQLKELHEPDAEDTNRPAAITPMKGADPFGPTSTGKAVYYEMARMWTVKAQLPPAVELHGWRLSIKQRQTKDGHSRCDMMAEHVATNERIMSFIGLRRRFGLKEADDSCRSTQLVPLTPRKRPLNTSAVDNDANTRRRCKRGESLVQESQAAQAASVSPATMERTHALLRTLRETITEEDGSTRSCRTDSLAALIGLSSPQYFHLVEYLERGSMPMRKSQNAALYLAAIGRVSQVCACSFEPVMPPPPSSLCCLTV
jgi:hypothetical protein